MCKPGRNVTARILSLVLLSMPVYAGCHDPLDGTRPLSQTGATKALPHIGVHAAFTSTTVGNITTTDLGVLPTGHDSYATAINNQGIVVGAAGTNANIFCCQPYAETAVEWDLTAGTITDLGAEAWYFGGSIDDYALDVNDAGTVVGWGRPYTEGGPFGFVRPSPSGPFNFVYTLAHPTAASMQGWINEHSQVNAISATGIMAGMSVVAGCDYSTNPNGYFGNECHRATVWSGGLPTQVGPLSGTTASYATAISPSGAYVAGYAFSGGPTERAFIWSSGASTDIGTLGGSLSHATGVNDNGEVVGYSTDAGGATHAFVWTQAGGMRALDVPSASSTQALAVNAKGDVVGYATTNANDLAILWTASGTVVQLGTLPGGVASHALDINDNGQIVGLTAYPGTTDWHATLWTVVLNRAPTAVGAGPLPGTEGSALAFDGSASSDPDGDVLTYAWDFGDGSTGSGVAPSHAYADNGSYTVTLVVTDSKGAASLPATAVAYVSNVPPALASVSGPTGPFAVNTSVSVSTTFTDPGMLDTHAATIDWGDGSASAGTVGGSNTAGTVSGAHAYAAAGVYTILVTVTDKDGGTSSSSFQYAVVYDLSAGFVTGGGWINSPAGAYAANPSMTGKATFGFVSRYLPGAQVPSGNTEFEFRAAALRFSSTSYQWLVVSGARAQYKGSGTLNGQSGYGFILTAVDGDLLGSGQSDQFRIKITDPNGGVVYDNQMGASDTDPLAGSGTLLGGGSIQIHH